VYVVRDAAPGDLDGLHAVARHLNTVNLPDDREQLARLLECSRRSFAGDLPPAERIYLLVLCESSDGAVVGTSMIHAQHGTRRAPHVYFDVLEEERYSETLDRHVRHRVFRIGYNYDGPTEIGGLILLPELRRTGLKLGRMLSFARFALIGAHREWFRDQVLSELLPALEPDGTSRLWESLGRRFIEMSYAEADRLSQQNKEFIRALFPEGPLFACLLPPEVQALVGVVGPQTRGVERMLRQIGFAYAHRIDPFDGGPHFTARTDEITLVRALRRATVGAGLPPAGSAVGLLACESEGPRFRATTTCLSLDGSRVIAPPQVLAALGAHPGAEVWVIPDVQVGSHQEALLAHGTQVVKGDP
jgi:arginine N-succinyltransferase